MKRLRHLRFERPVRIAAVALAVGLAFAAGAVEAACQPASFCSGGDNCLSIAAVEREAAAAYDSQGFRVQSVRLRGHAPTPTCLWYEVVLAHPEQGQRVIYWRIDGGEAR